MTIGQRIAERRKILGISQESLGERMGVSRQEGFFVFRKRNRKDAGKRNCNP